MSKKLVWLILALFALTMFGWSDTITYDDPATLHTGPGAGTACATGGCPIFGTEVNAITGNTVDIFQQSGGASALTNPWLLILGVPNVSNPALFSSASITSVTSTNAYPGGTVASGSATYGGSAAYGWNGQGYVGSMTATTAAGPAQNALNNASNNANVYNLDFFALNGKGIDASNSFANWSAADAAKDGITANSFGIYVFAVNAPLSGGGLTNFVFANGALPQGTFVVAYGNDGSHVYVNPFTEAGLETGNNLVTPEPASLALLGSGLLGLSGFARKKLRK